MPLRLVRWSPHWLRRLIVVGLFLATLVFALTLWAYFRLNDEALAARLGRLISAEIQGRVTVRRVHWSLRVLPDLLLGTPTPLEIEGARIDDPAGTRMIAATRVRATLRLRRALLARVIEVPEVEVWGGYCLVGRMPASRGPEPGVGIAEAFSGRRPAAPKKGSSSKGPTIELRHVVVHGATFALRIGPTRFDIRDIDVVAKLRFAGAVARDGFQLESSLLRFPAGEWRQHQLRIPLRGFTAQRVRIAGQDLLVEALRGEAAGARVRVDDGIRGLFREVSVFDARATVQQAGTAAGRLLGHGFAPGGRVEVTASGPLAEPRFGIGLHQLAAAPFALPLSAVEGQIRLDVGTGRIELQRLEAELLAGRVVGQGELDWTAGTWGARLGLSRVDLSSFVAPLAGALDGRIEVKGRLGDALSATADVGLTLQRRPLAAGDPWPRRLTLSGRAQLAPQRLELRGLSLRAEGNQLSARGSLEPRRRAVNAHVALELPQPGPIFDRAIGLRPLDRARGTFEVAGRYPRLTLRGELVADEVGYGARRLRQLRATVALRDGVLALTQLRGYGYGGELAGEGTLQLFDRDLAHPLPRPYLEARLRVDRVELAALGLPGAPRGRLAGRVVVEGPVDDLRGTASFTVPALVLAGERYRAAVLRGALLADRFTLYELTLERALGGGLGARGDYFHDGRVALRLALRRLPLTAVPGAAKVPVTAELGGVLELSGTARDPRLAGTLQLGAMRLRGMPLGAGWLRFTPATDSIALSGRLFDDRLAIEGLALTQPSPTAHLSVDFAHLPVHRLIPELARVEGLETLLGGELRVSADSVRGLTAATLRLAELDIALRYRPQGERQDRRVRLSNRDDLLLSYSDGRLQLVTARLVTSVPERGSWRPVAAAGLEQAELAVGGFAGPQASDLRLRGFVPLALAEFFLARRVRRITGALTADLRLTGPLRALRPSGWLAARDVAVTLPRFERPLELPAARLRIAPGLLELSQLRLRLGRQELGAHGRLTLAPSLPFTPHAVSLRVDGDLNLKLLQLLFADDLSQAAGWARLHAEIEGPVADPRLLGEVVLGHAELVPRALGRLIVLRQGRIAFSNYLVCLGGTLACRSDDESCVATEGSCRWSTPVEGSYDEGTIRLFGEARFDQRQLVDLYLRVNGNNLPQRAPGVYAIELNTEVTLVGDEQALALSGTVDIVDARYVREFDIIKNAVLRPRVAEESPPFWEGVPVLANLALQLDVRSAGQLRVHNSYADLGLQTTLSVGGTLAQPRIGGLVRVEEGTFRIPFLHGDYAVQRGEISFDSAQPADRALINIMADTQYADRNGTDYQIQLLLQGPLDAIRIRLSSQPHLEQGQILALLATGRTTDQWRDQLAGQSGGRAAQAADRQVKELTGQFLGQFLEDPIKQAIGLDLVRLEIGTESVSARACKNVGTAVEVCGEGERDFIGGFAGRASARYQMHDYVQLVGRLERLSTRLQREIENPSRGRLELRLRYPLR
ncbi:MAG: translocation/assembly module TamB domain-containing protein [Proteobacteria bacterium]|nr:translocation/assembly module TamB domain-containing protein [Pseudomonadota bacterium]